MGDDGWWLFVWLVDETLDDVLLKPLLGDVVCSPV
jgi:hypothetical protein